MNIVKAIFSGGCTQITAAGALWQWDQGQILQIVGLDLPDAYQVEFSNQPVRGTAAPMIGGVDGVEIPDVYLTTGKPVYAFVVLHAGEDDRETEYKITIPVNARPQPTDVQPTPEQQGVIDQLIAALNAGVEKAEDAADEAEGAADDAAAQAQAAAQSASSSASYAGDAAAQAGLAAAAKAGAEAAQAAAELAQGSAEAFATAAGVAKAAAETAQGKAEDAQAAAEAAQAEAESAKAGALAAKAAAETAQGKAEDAQEAAEQAAQDAHVEYEQLAGQVTAQGQTIAQHGQAIAQNAADIADLDTELTRQKSAIEDLETLVDRKAGALIDTASGAIASFVPDSTIHDLLGVSVDIEPVQDLRGYDSPWPAGGGVNKFGDYTIANGYISGAGVIEPNSENRTYVIPVSAETTYTIKIVRTPATGSTSNDDVQIGEFYGDERPVAGSSGGTRLKAGGYVNNLYTATFATGANAKWLAIKIGRTTVTNVEATAATVQLEIGSSVSAEYTPYENICPISGWDSVEVDRTGVNLLSHSAITQTIYGVTFTANDDGTISLSGTATQGINYILSRGARDWPNGTYTLSGCPAGGGTSTYYLRIDNATGGSLAHDWGGGTGRPQFTVTDGKIYTVFINVKAGVNTDGLVFRPMIETGTTASEYKPYAGNIYTIALGETVYGAKLTIAEDGSVKALVDRVGFTASALTWLREPSANPYFHTTIPYTALASGSLISSAYKVSAITSGTTTDKCCYIYEGRDNLRVRDLRFATASDFVNAMGGTQFMVTISTPITIPLDPVTIATIAGQTNNVWADAGDVDVTFAADLKHYIDSKIAAAVAALS